MADAGQIDGPSCELHGRHHQLCWLSGRDCPRRGTHFSTARKVSKRATPCFGFGLAAQRPLRFSRQAGLRKLASLKQAQAFSPATPMLGRNKGGERQRQKQKQRALTLWLLLFNPRLTGPSIAAGAGSDSRLSERSELKRGPASARSTGHPATAGPGSGAPSFGSLFLVSRKGTAPPGAIPASRPIKTGGAGHETERTDGQESANRTGQPAPNAAQQKTRPGKSPGRVHKNDESAQRRVGRSSTRRFSSRPSSVLLSATGWLRP